MRVPCTDRCQFPWLLFVLLLVLHIKALTSIELLGGKPSKFQNTPWPVLHPPQLTQGTRCFARLRQTVSSFVRVCVFGASSMVWNVTMTITEVKGLPNCLTVPLTSFPDSNVEWYTVTLPVRLHMPEIVLVLALHSFPFSGSSLMSTFPRILCL